MTRSTVWTKEATALRCPHCLASVGARCRTYDGRVTKAPHVGRLVPSFTCPACGTVTTEPTNVANSYCATCHEWTGPEGQPLQAAQDVLSW